MSSNTPKTTKTVLPATQLDDAWRPRRSRGGLRLVRRGRDKKLHFHDQQPDETVKMVVRKHWWFLVRPAFPLIGAIVAFLLVLSGIVAYPSLGPLWPVLEIVTAILIIVSGAWFLWRDFIVWWYTLDIITDKRIINWRGFLQPSRKETPLEKVQMVAIHQDVPLQFMLNYGNLHVYLVGGEILLNDIPDPKRVKDAIQGITATIPKKIKEKPPTLPDPEMDALLVELTKPKDLPKLPNPDEKYRDLPVDRRLGPKRTFGGPLRIICDVRYSWGESTVMYIQHSRYVLLLRLALPVLMLLVVLPLSVLVSRSGFVAGAEVSFWWFMISLLVIGLLISIGVIYINFVDDVYILTNKRIIDIERRLVFFFEERVETGYKNIRDIKVKVPNVLAFLLDIGDVFIETPGSSPDIILKTVAHPFFLQDKVYALKELVEKADDIKKENERKEDMHLWFAKVLTKMEENPHLKGSPNLLNLDLVDAMDVASEYGLQVVVWDEDPSHPEIPPGLVLHQNPPPGTVISQGGEIQVVLSKHDGPG